MNQSLFLESDSGNIGVIRNPYERLVSLYRDSWDYCGFDIWVGKSDIKPQVELYRDCKYIISLEHWEQDILGLGIEPKNSSILTEQTISDDYKRWYTNKSLLVCVRLIKPDLDTYGYSY